MRLSQGFIFGWLLLWFFYELVFIVGIIVASCILTVLQPEHLLVPLSLIGFWLTFAGMAFTSLFTLALRRQEQNVLSFEAFLCISAALLFAGFAGFQAALTVSVILATTFLYDSYPFYLRRWKSFFAIKYALDATAVFTLGMFFILQHLASLFFTLFFMFYIILLTIQKVVDWQTKHSYRNEVA